MAETFDPADLAAAERLDVAIDAVLAGAPAPVGDDRATGALLAHVAGMHDVAIPTGLDRRVAVAMARTAAALDAPRRAGMWLAPRLAAAALAMLLVGQAITDLFFGHWLAGQLHAAYAPHVSREGGLAYLALGALAAIAAARPRLLGILVALTTPLMVVVDAGALADLGHHGESLIGVTFHTVGALTAVGLAGLWWRAHRYVRARSGEGTA